jgi:iron complex outermembrane receptor protein
VIHHISTTPIPAQLENYPQRSLPRAHASQAGASWRRLAALAALILAARLVAQEPPKANGASAASDTTKAVELSKTVVTATSDPLAPPGLQETQQAIEIIPGGAAVISADALEKGRVSNIADALRFQPGVLAQSANGGEATRLSIRGSGLTRAPFLFGWGTQVLLDGLPLYSTSGVPYETIEPLVVSNIQVLRGANGFDYGPVSLGGVINYVTHTGYDADRVGVRFEAGSFGYYRFQASSGQVIGPFDYYLSATHFEQSGYRVGTGARSNRMVANFGYRLSPSVVTRFNFRYARQLQGDAGSLTWAQLQSDPRQSQFPDIRLRDNPKTYLFSNNTTVEIDRDSSLELGLQYHNYPINSYGGPSPNRFPFEDISGSLRYRRKDTIFGGKPSSTFIGFYGYDQLYTRFDSLNAAYQLTGRRLADLSEYTLVLSNELEFATKLWLTTGLAGIDQRRETEIAFSSATILNAPRIERRYTNLAPRLGARYELAPDVQVFANVSRSIDTPSSNSYVRTNALLVPIATLNLDPQKATTAELGTKGRSGIFEWDLSLYRSWIRNELLVVQIAPGSPPVTATANASPTIHQGVEVSFTTTLWQQPATGASHKPTQRWFLRQVYTWNDFYFEHDPIYGKNELPAVPRQVYQAELGYEHTTGFYAALNISSVLSKYAIDFAGSFFAQPYAVWGARIGYAPGGRWDVFAEWGNIGDKRYAAVVAPIFNAGGTDRAVFSPGVGPNFSAGLTLRF